MAKKTLNGRTKWIVIGIMLLGSFAGVVAKIATQGEKITTVCNDVNELKATGSVLATENKMNIALTQQDVSHIKEDVAAVREEQEKLRTEQTTAFDKILKRLPEKPE